MPEIILSFSKVMISLEVCHLRLNDQSRWHCRIHNVLLSIQRKVIDKGGGYRFIGKIRVGSRYLGTGVSIGSFVCRTIQKNCRWQFSCIVDDRVEIMEVYKEAQELFLRRLSS